MEIRKAEISHIDRIFEIYDIGRAYMRKNGNFGQWNKGYPYRELVENDIKEGNSFLVCDVDNICGVFFFRIGNDETYDYIEGDWLNDKPYGVIHRIASSGENKGILKAATDFAFSQIDNVRIDTYIDNIPMMSALSKLGFIRCGTIYLKDKAPRIAYHKTV